LLFLHSSGLLVLLGLEYFVLLQLLVYVGALAILFLFVVMLLDIPSTEILAHQRGTYPVAGVLALCLLRAGLLALWQPVQSSSLQNLPSFFLQNNERNNQLRNYRCWKSLSASTGNVVNLGIALYGVHAD
jgi:NADH:ubiquinone oxidoreductase subunit 6 (subunit J)